MMKLGGILNLNKSKYFNKPAPKMTKQKFRKNLLKFFAYFLGFIVLLFLWYAKDVPTPSKLSNLHASQSTQILDNKGGVLYETGNERRTVIDKSQMPDIMRNATVAVEDANFYKHRGIDIGGIARAAINDILHLKLGEGGSTITQQFVKNAVLTNEKAFSRKIKEAIISIELEMIYPKDQILTMYLNEIPYGGNVYGIEEASNVYFGKEPKDLTLSEAATLAAIPQAPTYYSPYGTHTDNLFARKNYVLDRMQKLGYASAEDVAKAKADAPNTSSPNFKARQDSIKAPYFVMYVKEKLVEQYGEKMVNSGGLKVTTSLDPDKQAAAEQAVQNGVPKITRYGATNAALVSLNNLTGEIVAMVGGKDFFDIKNGGNVNVTDSQRQPGSSFKPIVYATAFKQPRFSPSFNLFDVKTDFSGYSPSNYDGSTHGAVTMRTALANSLNIPAVKTLALVGIPEALKTAKDLGITTLTQPDRYGLSLVLGGAEVKPVEMAGAFSAFGNKGEYHKPTAITKVEDHTGKVLYEYKPDSNKSTAVDPQVAYEVTDILKDNSARAMVFGTNNALNFGDKQVAAKTGTTSDFHDAWTVGYTTKYSAAVWVGNNDNAKMKGGADGSVVAAPIFHDYMAKLVDDSKFERPAGIQEITVEKFSNRLPTQYSQQTVRDIFAAWQVPTEKDNVNMSYRVNKSNNQLATDSTPMELIEEKIFSNIHNEWGDQWQKYMNWENPVRAWAEANGFLLPPQGKDDSYSSRPTVSITAPANNQTVSGNVTLSVSANSQHGVSRVTYYLNDTEVGSSSSNPYSTTFDSTKYANGTYKLTAKLIDENGVSNESSVSVVISNSTLAISGVSVSAITANSANISFATNTSGNSTIYYSTDPGNLSSSKSSGSSTKSHSATLSGLSGATKYYFRIDATSSQGNASYSGNFTTS